MDLRPTPTIYNLTVFFGSAETIQRLMLADQRVFCQEQANILGAAISRALTKDSAE